MAPLPSGASATPSSDDDRAARAVDRDRRSERRPREAPARRARSRARRATRARASAHPVTASTTIPSAAASCVEARRSRPPGARASQPSSSPSAAATRSSVSRRRHLARREQAEARAAQQHVADAARLLGAHGVDGLGEQVGEALDDRRREVRALGGDPQHRRGLVTVARRRARRTAPSATPAERSSSSGSTCWPSGISCVRQGASRASRSTIRSTVIFAIRRQVVSLPPVIVIMPLEVSYSSALREMSTEDFESVLEISGRTPANAPAICAAPERRAEELVDRGEQVVDVLVGRQHVLELAVVVVVGRADERLAEPWQREDRAPAAGRHDRAGAQRQIRVGEDQVRAAARADLRHLGLVVQLLRPQPVGPHAGRVDDVRRRARRASRRCARRARRTPRARPSLERQLLDGEVVGADGAEALGLAEHRQHQPRVVGLAVVEEVAGARLARARAPAAARAPPRRRSRGGGPGSSASPLPRRPRRRSTDITS